MRPPSRSYRAGLRGRHKHAASPETRRWEQERRPPAQPGWMGEETYAAPPAAPAGAGPLSVCTTCGAAVAQPSLGRRRSYCSHRCREQAYRDRHAVTKLEVDPQVSPMPRVARQRFPVRSFATFGELDDWLEERS